MNNDDITDQIKLKVTFQCDPTTIRSVKMMLFFNYALSNKVNLLMQSMSLIDIDTPIGASYIYTNGMLNLQQKSPISSGSISRSMYYTDIFQNATSPFDFLAMYTNFASRNFTTTYNYDKFVMPYRSSKELQIEMDINIPSYQEVM